MKLSYWGLNIVATWQISITQVKKTPDDLQDFPKEISTFIKRNLDQRKVNYSKQA